MIRRAMLDEELGQTMEYIVRVQSSLDDNGHALREVTQNLHSARRKQSSHFGSVFLQVDFPKRNSCPSSFHDP